MVVGNRTPATAVASGGRVGDGHVGIDGMAERHGDRRRAVGLVDVVTELDGWTLAFGLCSLSTMLSSELPTVVTTS